MSVTVVRPAKTATLCCGGCGRRMLEYTDLGTSAVIRVRCRDCKAYTELRGADVPALLGLAPQPTDQERRAARQGPAHDQEG